MEPTPKFETAVLDIAPWPNGHGFSGRKTFWEYVMRTDERQKLDQMLGIALLDPSFRDQLLHHRSDQLLQLFGLAPDTLDWLKTVQVNTLPELARAVSGAQHQVPSIRDARIGAA